MDGGAEVVRRPSKITMIRRARLIVCLLVAHCFQSTFVHSQESTPSASAKASYNSDFKFTWNPHLILGARTGQSESDGQVEFLMPILSSENSMLFIYPRLGLSSDVDPGFSFGGGFRQYLSGPNAIIGANLFFDRYGSRNGNFYNQLGIGTEVLTERVDFRFNYYIAESDANIIEAQSHSRSTTTTSSEFGAPFGRQYSILQPLTTTRTTKTITQLFERFEDSMDGFDTELGYLLPFFNEFGEFRLFGGYYGFGNPYGDDIEGVKARAEMRLSSKFAIDTAWYEDEEITGDNWVFGFRVNIPIEDGPNSIKNMFSGILRDKPNASRSYIASGFSGGKAPSFASSRSLGDIDDAARKSVRSRMTEEVLRDANIHMAESDFIENVRAREIDIDTEVKTVIVVVGDSVVFVSNIRGSSAGLGTFESPLDTILLGVNLAAALFGNAGDVVVHGSPPYVENVVDAGKSVKLWGGGVGVPAFGGRRFTFGGTPTLDGGFEFSDIGSVTVSGFEIVNGYQPTVDIITDEVSFLKVGGNGITTNGVSNVTVVSNDISVGEHAVEMNFDDDGDNRFLVANNKLHDNGGDAIYVDDVGDNAPDDSLSGTIRGNTISNSDGGFEVDLQDVNGKFKFDIFGNTFTGTTDAIYVFAGDMDGADQTLTLNVVNNTFSDNEDGIELYYADGDNEDVNFSITANVIGNSFIGQNSDDFILTVGADDGGGAHSYSLVFENNIFDTPTDASIEIVVDDTYDGGGTEVTWDISVKGNEFISSPYPVYIVLSESEDGFDSLTVDIDVSNNVINDASKGHGIEIVIGDGDVGDVNLAVNNNRISNVTDSGIHITLSDMDTSTAIIGGNIINNVGGTGLFFNGNSTDIMSTPFGNNLISDADDFIFGISDVDGQFLINGVLRP